MITIGEEHQNLEWVLSNKTSEVQEKLESISFSPLKVDPPLDEILKEATRDGFVEASPYFLTPEGRKQIPWRVLRFLRKQLGIIVRASFLRKAKDKMSQKELVDEFRLQITYLFDHSKLKKMKRMALSQLPTKEALVHLLMSVYILEEGRKRGLVSQEGEDVVCEEEKLLSFRGEKILGSLLI